MYKLFQLAMAAGPEEQYSREFPSPRCHFRNSWRHSFSSLLIILVSSFLLFVVFSSPLWQQSSYPRNPYLGVLPLPISSEVHLLACLKFNLATFACIILLVFMLTTIHKVTFHRNEVTVKDFIDTIRSRKWAAIVLFFITLMGLGGGVIVLLLALVRMLDESFGDLTGLIVLGFLLSMLLLLLCFYLAWGIGILLVEENSSREVDA